jgi:hypothetical protein
MALGQSHCKVMTQSYRGLYYGKASQLPTKDKGEKLLMSNSIWMTPEEAFRKKKMRKKMIYASIMTGTAVLTTVVTYLANSI